MLKKNLLRLVDYNNGVSGDMELSGGMSFQLKFLKLLSTKPSYINLLDDVLNMDRGELLEIIGKLKD